MSQFVLIEKAVSQLTSKYGDYLKTGINFGYENYLNNPNNCYIQNNYLPALMVNRIVSTYDNQFSVEWSLRGIYFVSPMNCVLYLSHRTMTNQSQHILCVTPAEMYNAWFENNDKYEELNSYVNNKWGDNSFKTTTALNERIEDLLLEKNDLLNDSMTLESEVKSYKSQIKELNESLNIMEKEHKKALKLLVSQDKRIEDLESTKSTRNSDDSLKLIKKQDKIITRFRQQIENLERLRDGLDKKLSETTSEMEALKTSYDVAIKGSSYESEYKSLVKKLKMISLICQTGSSENERVNTDSVEEQFVTRNTTLPPKKREIQRTLHYYYTKV